MYKLSENDSNIEEAIIAVVCRICEVYCTGISEAMHMFYNSKAFDMLISSKNGIMSNTDIFQQFSLEYPCVCHRTEDVC